MLFFVVLSISVTVFWEWCN